VKPPKTVSTVRSRVLLGNAARLAITLVALFAFTLQSFVTQVHIHKLASGNIAAAQFDSGKTSFGNQKQGKSPTRDDPANCPLCQEILLAGHFVTPSPVAWTPLSVETFTVPIAIVVATIPQTYSHSWKSRAPPFA